MQWPPRGWYGLAAALSVAGALSVPVHTVSPGGARPSVAPSAGIHLTAILWGGWCNFSGIAADYCALNAVATVGQCAAALERWQISP